MKEPQFILSEDSLMESENFDFETEIQMKKNYPFLYKAIHNLCDYLHIDLNGWEIEEGHIFDDYYEVTYNLKLNNSIYFMVSGEIDSNKIINMDFEMAREIASFQDSIFNSIAGEEET